MKALYEAVTLLLRVHVSAESNDEYIPMGLLQLESELRQEMTAMEALGEAALLELENAERTAIGGVSKLALAELRRRLNAALWPKPQAERPR